MLIGSEDDAGDGGLPDDSKEQLDIIGIMSLLWSVDTRLNSALHNFSITIRNNCLAGNQ